ncbi:MAG TPA: GNAT family protein [Hyphomicrobiales bacterium]|nr:GNAT family protein [Kaistiaceae bacterium]HQF30917.1 GNAT family protein [Hyphomicrobiales bacterium]
MSALALLRSLAGAGDVPVLHGEGVLLRVPTMDDFAAWTALRADSRVFLKPWEPVWPVDDLTRGAFRRRIRRYNRDIREDTGYPFLILASDGSELVGGINLSNVRRGVVQAATLGYWMGSRFAGRGLMSAAVRALQPFAFGRLGLHRIEAACLPGNAASQALLEKVGFVREGYARRYLCIDGEWQDHLLYACLAEDLGR